MIRVLLVVLLPIVAPLAIYTLWRLVRERRAGRADVSALSVLSEGPWPWIMTAGAVVGLACLVLYAEVMRSPTDAVYQPSRFVDGEIVPSRMVTDEP